MGLAVCRDWEQIASFPWQLNVGCLLLAAILYSLTLMLMFLVWQSILARMGGFSDLRKNLRVYYLSSLARRLPSAAFYMAGRLYMYQQEELSVPVVIASTAIETLAIALGGVIAYLLLLPCYSLSVLSDSMLPVVGAGVLLVAVLARPHGVIALFNKATKLLRWEPVMAVVRRRDIAAWVMTYVAAWFVGGAGLFCLINAIYVLPLSALPGVIGIATISTLISLLTLAVPGGSSLKELALSALLSSYVPFSVAVATAIAYRVWLTVLDMLWAALAHRL
jgi:hypothetical protein